MSLTQLKQEVREKVAYIVLNQDCRCGFGEPRGPQCDCGYEVKQSIYLSHQFLDTLIDKVVDAVEESAMKYIHAEAEYVPNGHEDRDGDYYIVDAGQLKDAFRNFKQGV